jgi:RNA polymerase sigma-70 factor (ECF subfamily)
LIDDSALVTRAKAGDYEAFDQLVSRHERRLYALAIGIVRDQADAEDVVQTAFLSALEHLDSFREEAAFGTWISRIATHAALKVTRKRKGLETVPYEEEPADDGQATPHPEYIADWRGDPAEITERQELRQLLDEAIASLPENYRLVFVLRDVSGLSVAETAQELGLTEANVKVRLMRARLALREKLTRVFGDESTRVFPDHTH